MVGYQYLLLELLDGYNFGIDNIMDNIEYKISRYELYPPDFHTSISVGFLIKDNVTNVTGTIDLLVPLEEVNGKTPKEVCDLAFSKASDRHQSLMEYFQKKRDSVVNSYFIKD
jgi:hypothetical protein